MEGEEERRPYIPRASKKKSACSREEEEGLVTVLAPLRHA